VTLSAVRLRRPGSTALLVLTLAASALLAAHLPAATGVGSWPQWHGPNRDNLSAATGLLQQWGPNGPNLAWRATGLGAGFSSLAITQDHIYTMGDQGEDQYVLALPASGGKIVWKTRIGAAWDDEYPGPRGTPTLDGDVLYAIGTDGDLVCLDTATGKERWRRSLARDFGGFVMSGWKYAESPLIDGNKLIVTPGGRNATLVALDKTTGKELWRSAVPSFGSAGRDGAGYSSIVISEGAGVRQYVQLLGRGVVGIRASDGKFLWGYDRVANGVANISTPLVTGDYVFASTGYGTGSGLLKLTKEGDGVKATEVYFLDGRTFQNHHGGFVFVNNHIYGGHGQSNGFPICIELTSGQVKWGGNIRGAGSGSAAVTYAENHLYFRYQDGTIALIEATPTGYQLKGSFRLPNVNIPSWSHPVVLDGKLYLREQDTLYVYNIKRA